MTAQEIREKLKTEEYDFLRINPLLDNNIILLTTGGSHAYGTNIETSDLDIRGCAIEQKKHLLTNSTFEQVMDNTTDTTIYSLKKLISLLSACNPNVIEMLGSRPEHYFHVSPAGQMLLDNRKLFLSKAAYRSFGGYASAQLRRLDNKTARTFSEKENEEHIAKRLNEMAKNFPFDFSVSETEEGEKICISGEVKNVPFREFFSDMSILNQTVKEYERNSKRNKHAEEHGKIAKHMMHLLRLYMMAIDILKNEEIVTYRENEHDLLISIRQGAFLDEDRKPTKEFFGLVKEYEDRMQKAMDASKLPEKPNHEKIQKLMMDMYETYVFA